jgi:hypothetical protein
MIFCYGIEKNQDGGMGKVNNHGYKDEPEKGYISLKIYAHTP